MTNCRLCSFTKPRFLFDKYDFSILKCPRCGLIYADLNPDRIFLTDYYSKDYFQSGGHKRSYADYRGEADSLRATFKQRFRHLNLTPGKVLDIGCAYGYFLNILPSAWKKSGIEISSHAVKVARSLNPDAQIVNGLLSARSFPRRHFNLVTLWDVIEHVPDPLDVLRLSHSLLEPGGQLALTTGDVDSTFARLQGQNWHLYNPPQHLSYFSASTMIKLLKKVGFRKISVSHHAAYYPLSYLLHKLKTLYHLPLPQPVWADKIILPVNLGDIMLVTAVK